MSLIVLYLCYNTKSCSWTMLAGLNASCCCSTDKYCKSVTKFVEYFEEDLYATRIWNVRCRVCSCATLQKAPEKISGPGHNAELLYLRDSINPTIYLLIYQFIPLFSSHFPLPFFLSRLGYLSGLQHEASNIQTKKHYSRAESILDENSDSSYCSIKLKRLLKFIRRVRSWKNERYAIYGSVCQDWLCGRLSRTQMQDSGTRELN